MAIGDDVRRIKGGLALERHRLLSAVAGVFTRELQDRAGLVMLPPTGKRESGSDLSVRLLATAELSDSQRQQVVDVLQRFRNPTELLRELQQSDSLGRGAG